MPDERALTQLFIPIYLELNYHWMEQFGWSLSDLRQPAASMDYVCYRETGGRFIATDQPGIGIESALLVPRNGEMAQAAQREFGVPS